MHEERGDDSLGLVPTTDLTDGNPVAGGRATEDRSGYDLRQSHRGSERPRALNEAPPSALG